MLDAKRLRALGNNTQASTRSIGMTAIFCFLLENSAAFYSIRRTFPCLLYSILGYKVRVEKKMAAAAAFRIDGDCSSRRATAAHLVGPSPRYGTHAVVS